MGLVPLSPEEEYSCSRLHAGSLQAHGRPHGSACLLTFCLPFSVSVSFYPFPFLIIPLSLLFVSVEKVLPYQVHCQPGLVPASH